MSIEDRNNSSQVGGVTPKKSLEDKSVAESILEHQITSLEVRKKIEDPSDAIHGQIKKAVHQFCQKSKYSRDHMLREDLVQEVSLAVWQNTKNFANPSYLNAWI